MTFVFSTANKYIERLCEDVIQAMRKCCEVHAGENCLLLWIYQGTQRQSCNLNSMHVYLLQEIRGHFHGHMEYIFFKDYIIVWHDRSCLFIQSNFH